MSKKTTVIIRQLAGRKILDVGGRDFFLRALEHGVDCESWIVLEPAGAWTPSVRDKRFKHIVGDGCVAPFAENSFDTVINCQVLEHVMRPSQMVRETFRMLRPGGYALIVVPQTGILHGIPMHFYNFTRYWCENEFSEAGFEVKKIQPLGGYWQTIYTRLMYLPVLFFKHPVFSEKNISRRIGVYLIAPVQLFLVPLIFLLFLFFSWVGDFEEDACNHLVVARKPDKS